MSRLLCKVRCPRLSRSNELHKKAAVCDDLSALFPVTYMGIMVKFWTLDYSMTQSVCCRYLGSKPSDLWLLFLSDFHIK